MRALIELASPMHCVGCGREASVELCTACAQRVTVLVQPLCARCGAPGGRKPCPCAAIGGFDRARSLVAFAEPARALTLALKRRGSREIAGGLASLMADLATAHGLATRGSVVAFVPGGRGARTRGFDHVELIAQGVADRLGATGAPLLRRVGEGPRQADVPFAQRLTNVRHRFGASAASGHVLLVDDVFTTGSTAQACAEALKAAGASCVDVVTWARTLLKGQGPPRSVAILRS